MGRSNGAGAVEECAITVPSDGAEIWVTYECGATPTGGEPPRYVPAVTWTPSR